MKNLKETNITTLLELYIQSAQGYIDETRQGTARAANRHHSVAERVFKELKRREQDREILLLLSHPRPAVRLWAAIHALGIEPEAAQRALESLREDPTPAIKSYARLALEAFQRGDLPETR